MTTGIYKITNLVNNKVYIGASKNIEKRWSEHKRRADSPIHSDLEALGEENFKFEVLLECPETMLTQWERDMICLYDADDPEKGYNSKNDRPYSLKVSETHKGKPSGMKGHVAWNRGLKTSDETKRKMSEANRGHTVSDETRRKISEAHKGLSTSEETKRKLSEARKEYWRKKKNLTECSINGLKIHSNNEKQNKQI